MPVSFIMLKLWERTTVSLKKYPQISVHGIGTITLGIGVHILLLKVLLKVTLLTSYSKFLLLLP